MRKIVFRYIIIKSRELNQWMPNHIVELLEKALQRTDKQINTIKIAILGVAFLENSDDTRNTPTRTLYENLIQKGAQPILHDPYVREFDIPFSDDLNTTIENADALILMTKHKDYLQINLEELYQKMHTPIIIDGRNAFSKHQCESIGFIYYGIGKPY